MKTSRWYWSRVVFKSLGVGVAVGVSVLEVLAQGARGSREEWIAVARGPHQTLWERVEWKTNEVGEAVAEVHSFVTLATGLNYFDETTQQWQPGREAWEAYPDAIVARWGQHKVILPHNLVNGTDVLTPDGVRLVSTPVSLGFYDPVDGKQAVVAEVKDCVAERGAASNEIVYRDCFDRIRGSIRYRYTLAGVHQHVVLEQKLALPEGFSDRTRLEVYTEFAAGTPTPAIQTRVLRRETSPALRAAMVEPDFTDSELSFGGEMSMRAGKAFRLETESEAGSIRVGKQFQVIEGRPVLIEAVEFGQLEPLLARLASVERAKTGLYAVHSARQVKRAKEPTRLPVERLPAPGEAPEIQLASHPLSEPAVVIDWELLTSSTATLRADTTYLVTNAVYLTSLTLEGGSVVKLSTNGLAQIHVSGSIDCRTDAYRPVVFTAQSDDTVGEVLPGSTGNPTNYYGNGLSLGASGGALKHLRFSHASSAVRLNFSEGQVALANLQVVHCQSGVDFDGNSENTVNLDNCLFYGITNVTKSGYDNYLRGRHVTVNQCQKLFAIGNGNHNGEVYLTNSILADVVQLGNADVFDGTHNGFYNSPTFGSNQRSSASYPFQTVGGGSHYLIDGSTLRDAGTTNLSADLLAALKQKTTYPPILLTNNFSANTNLGPQAGRDTDQPDLGWHYDAADWVVSGRTISANVTLTNGVVLGTYGLSSSYGLVVSSGSLVSEGAPTQLNWIVRYNTVQEQATTNWSSSSVAPSVKLGATTRFRFTGWSLLGNNGNHVYASKPGVGSFSFRDCQFGGGGFYFYGDRSGGLTNCLWERVSFYLENWKAEPIHDLYNNLFRGGSVYVGNGDGGVTTLKDNLFDGTTLNQYGDIVSDNNGYVTNCNRLSPNGSNDVILSSSPAYLTSHLGWYYYPTNDGLLSLLINSGSRWATNAGLYHFTTTTNQVKEAGSKVDIGFHFIAVDGGGNPSDWDGDGIPDHREDLNGNGAADSGETAWNNPDTDYDGRSDGQELVDGTNPLNAGSVSNVMLGYWRFDNTNTWVGEQGQLPLLATNVSAVASWDTNAVLINSTNPAILSYRDVEANASANINCRQGSVRFWFRPSWVSQTNGTGPQSEARLIEVGAKGSNGWWGLVLSAGGTNVYFCTQTNTSGSLATNLAANIAWPFYDWHQIVLTYSPTNSALYVDGRFVTNGWGVTNWPDASVRAQGFRIGSDGAGTNQAKGRFENLETYNYVLSGDSISNGYALPCYPAVDVVLVVDRSGSMSEGLGDGKTKLEAAKVAGSNFIAQLTANIDQAGLVSFTSTSKVDQVLTTNGGAVIAALYGLQAGGTTRIDYGITNAHTELTGALRNPRALPVMVVLSDGANYEAYTWTNVPVAAAAAKAADIRIIAVALGTGADTNLMKNHVASSTNDYYYATNSSQLTGVYNLIAASICRGATNEPPSVSWVTPTNGQLFVFSPTNILFEVTATNSTETITNLAIYSGTNKLGETSGGWLQLLGTNVAAGNYSFTAWATNDQGAAGSANVSFTVNAMPVVVINTPTNLQSFLEVTNVALWASAWDTDGSITNVQFYAETNSPPALLGDASLSGTNYTLTWNTRFADFYPITAVATDNRGAKRSSQISVFEVLRTNTLPFVEITFPTNNMSFRAGADITITASATNGSGVVTNVTFFVNGQFLGEDTTSPYGISECCWKPGQYRLEARAADTLGGSFVSVPVNITVAELDPKAGNGSWDANFPLDDVYRDLTVYAVVVDAAGNMYASGYNDDPSDNATPFLKWDGSSWTQLGNMLDGVVYAIAPLGAEVYAAGEYASGTESYVSKWDGTNWSAVGSALNDIVRAIAVIGSEVYIGGDFTQAGADTNVQYIAKLSGTNWIAVGNGLTANDGVGVRAINSIGNQIYIGGDFIEAGGSTNVQFLAKLVGTNWSAAGGGVNGVVRALAVCNQALYVGGDFNVGGGLTNANGIAKWERDSWSLLGDGLSGGTTNYQMSVAPAVYTITAKGNVVFAGGKFDKVRSGTNEISANHIAQATWSEAHQAWTWTAMEEGVAGGFGNNAPFVLASALRESPVTNGFELFAGGNFFTAGQKLIDSLGRWTVGLPSSLSNQPSLLIISPTNGESFTAPDSIDIVVAAAALGTNGLNWLEVFADGESIGFVLDPPETNTITWWTPSAGVHTLTALVREYQEGELPPRSAKGDPVFIVVGTATNGMDAVDDGFTLAMDSPPTTLSVLANDTGAVRITQVFRVLGNNGTIAAGFGMTNLVYSPGGKTFGKDLFVYAATNAVGDLDWAYVTVDVRARPEIGLTAPYDGQRFLTSSPPVTITGITRDWDGTVTNVGIFINNALHRNIVPNASGGFTTNWTTNTAGFYSLKAVATDSHGFTNGIEAVTIVLTNATGSPNLPIATITNLLAVTNGSYGIESVDLPLIREGLFGLRGRAADPDAGDAVAYAVLLFRPEDEDGDVPLEEWDNAYADVTPGPLNARGFHVGGDSNGDLGTLDLTRIPNGIYDLVLRVRGGTDETNAIVRVQIESELKIGQFGFSEQDLTIPVNGIPLAVVRTYNSMNPRAADFGYSWTYALNSMEVVLEDERQDVTIGGATAPFADDEEDENGLLRVVSLRTGGGRDVTLTLPDGRRTTFVFKPTFRPADCQADAAWEAPPGVTDTLKPLDSGVINLIPTWEPFWQDGGFNSTFENHDIQGWVLESLDGTKFYITRGEANNVVWDDTGEGHYINVKAYAPQPKLEWIEQRTGDWIHIADTGIEHYANATNLTRSVYIEREAAGRISAIRDPNSGSNGLPVVKYVYNRDTGNLIWVQRLTDREAGTYQTVKYHYDNPNYPHYITSIEDPRGIPVTRNLYDDAGRLIGMIDAAGNTNRFEHDIANRIETIIDPLGFGLTNHYDPRGNITMTVNALGQTNHFSHNDDNRLIYSVNPLGHTNSYGYDENGYRDAITNALGEVTRFGFDNFGQLLSKTDALTNTTSFEYNSTGQRTAVEDALGNRTSFAHDAFGRPTAVTNALNQLRATAGSDDLGDLLFVSQEGGLRMDFARDLNGNTTNTSFVWINPDNTNQTQNLGTLTEFDAAGRITRVVDPDNQERLTVYDHAGRVQHSVNRMGNTNAFLYDALGNVIEISYEDGTVERSVYDARSQVVFTMDRHEPGSTANGTHNVFDALGRVTRATRLADVQIDIIQNGVAPRSVLVSTGAVLAASSTVYDAASRVRFVTNALGRVTEYAYDNAGRQTAVIDALNNRNDSVYDAAGRLRFVTNALGNVMRYDYDAKGRGIKTVFPDNSFITNSYNEIGQLVAVKDQAGLTTDSEYDDLGRLEAVLMPQVFDPQGGTNARPRFEYEYDAYGNVRVVRDAKGRETTFTYDSFGQLLSRELPLTETETSLYNALGQLTNRVDFKGQTNRFVYDSLGRVTTNLLYASGASTAGQTNIFDYQSDGKLFRITRPEGTTTFGYNVEGAVTNIVSPEGTLNYEYDPTAGYLTRVYTVNTDVQYAYDELARLKTVTIVKRNGTTLGTPEVTTNTYTALGQIENVYFPNGTRSFYEYNALNHLTNLVNYGTSGQVLARYEYTVASDGRRMTATEIRLESGGGYSTNQVTWGYDDVRQLTQEKLISTISGLSHTNSYVYDLAGNRLGKTNVSNAGTEVIGYAYNANDQLLTEASSVNGTFTNYYDANGSLTNRSSASETNLFVYNLEGRLATAIVLRAESGNAVEQTNHYSYNHTGIRVRTEMARRVNGGALVNETNVFLNDPLNPSGFSQVLEELSAVGATPTVTYTLGHRVLSQEKGGTVSHLMADGHGSTRLLTGSSGVISHRYTYDAYGMALDFSPGVLNPPQTALLYSGEQFDVGMRQYYQRARYYNPAVGRFNRMDAFGGVSTDPHSLHKYAYAHNDPVNLRDPSGNASLAEVSIATSITLKLQKEYLKVVAKHGYPALKKATELGQSRGSILDAAARNRSPGSDAAAIIVHGVSNKEPGWSQSQKTPFQQDLTEAALSTPIPGITGQPLNHDFYEFNWGGFSIGGLGAIPVKSVHQMALVHLEMAQFLVWMNGYADIDLISHSWGTTLTYDLQNVSGTAMRHWVTMGSPLKSTTPKPPGNTGNWINLYDLNDPVVHFEMFPPFPDVAGLPLPSWGPGLTSTKSSVTAGLNISYNFNYGLFSHPWVHSDYWTSPKVATDLRLLLQ